MSPRGKGKNPKTQLTQKQSTVTRTAPAVIISDEIRAGNITVHARPLFWFSLAAVGLFLLWGASRIGVPADTPIDFSYGKASLSYFKSFGADTTYAALKVNDISFPDQKYYGALFEMISPVLNLIFHPTNPFITHHILCALAGIVLLLFTGLIAKRLKGWTAGLLALWLIFLTPVISGNAFFNSKDIPFAAAFAAGFYYLVLFIETLPSVKRSTLIGLAAAVFAAVSIRISGILLPAYLVFFTLGWYFFSANKKDNTDLLRKCFLPLSLATGAGALLGFLTYPNFWEEGWNHITGGLAATKKFQHTIFMLYEGQIASSRKIDPVSYLSNSIIMTVPEIVMIGFLVSVLLLFFQRKRFKNAFTWMLIYAAIFPIAYVMFVKAPIYNGWRHVMFAYPFIISITAIGLTGAFELLKNISFRYALSVLLIAAMVDLMVWQARAFPYNYVYYNHLSGGLPGAYKEYDTDYQQLATHDAVKWLLDNNPPENKRVVILSNNANALQYEYDSTKVKFLFVAVKDMWMADWDYAVLSTVFLNKKAIEAMFPPLGTLHSIERFDVPLSFVVKRESRDDLIVYRMMKADSVRAATDIIDKVYQSNKTNIMSWYWKACTLYLESDYEGSLKLLNDYNQLFPMQDYIYELYAYNLYSQGRFEEALNYLNVVYKTRPSMRTYNKMIGDCLMNLGRPEQAKFYYDKLK